MKNKKIVITGNPIDGYEYFGPFDEIADTEMSMFDYVGDWWVGELIEKKLDPRDEDQIEHVFLIGFSVMGTDEKNAQENFMCFMEDSSEIYQSDIVSWWIAEDTRYDNSDNESAIFIPKTITQTEARSVVENVR